MIVYHTSSVILLAKRHLPHPINLEQIFHVKQGKAFNLFWFEIKSFAKTLYKDNIPNAFPLGEVWLLIQESVPTARRMR